MSGLALHNSTGNPHVDRILQEIVARYEQAFPDSIRAYYVIGSYADASNVSMSDLDVAIIFAKPLTQEHLTHAQAVAHHCTCISPIRLDIGFACEHHLSVRDCITLKLGSLFVYGDDIRDSLRLPPIDLYQRYVTWGPYRFLGQVIRRYHVLAYPLTYPDTIDPSRGYTKKCIAAWYPATVEAGTKELITGVTRAGNRPVGVAGQPVRWHQTGECTAVSRISC